MANKAPNESLCLDKRFIFIVLFVFFGISGALFYFASKPNSSLEESLTTVKSDISRRPRVVNITSSFACSDVVSETRRIKSIWLTDLNMSTLACKTFSRSFPSLGGLGCPCPCNNMREDLNLSSSTSTITTHFSSSYFHQHSELSNKIKTAQGILQEFGKVTPVATKLANLNLVNHCCSQTSDLNKVNATLYSSNITIPTSSSILFDQVTCQITGPNDTVTIMLMVDRSSAKKLYNITTTLSKEMERKGLKNNYFESQYGIAIATVDVKYPCTLAIRKVNNNIYRRNWTTNGISLGKPVCGMVNTFLNNKNLKV